MMLTSEAGARPSPMRLLEMLSDRFGLFEALAYSTIKLNRCTQADELAMDPLVAETVLEFGTICAAPAPPRTRGRSRSGSRRRRTPETTSD